MDIVFKDDVTFEDYCETVGGEFVFCFFFLPRETCENIVAMDPPITIFVFGFIVETRYACTRTWQSVGCIECPVYKVAL